MKNLLPAMLLSIFFVSCNDDTPPPPPDAPQLFEYKITPSTTHAPITQFNAEHFVYLDTRVTRKNKLFVFLPGTSGAPGFYQLILKQAAAAGFHTIGLMYPNASDMYIASSASPDNTQFSRCRLEILTGTDATNGVNVDVDNCINTRLVKLLQYLQQQYPAQNWQQFLSGSNPDWSKITVAGHSQGGGHAFYISKLQTVDRAISFSSIDWNSLLARSAAWVSQPGATPATKLYSFVSPADQLFAYANVQTQWADMGLTGPVVNSDNTSAPYANSRTLITTATPAFNAFVPDHNITCLDLYVPKLGTDPAPAFINVWNYLIGR
jgi:hypothetical protein